MRESQRGAECPECGDLRTSLTAAGHDADGHRVRLRTCAQCGERFTTVEVVLPFDFFAVDVTKRERRRHAMKLPPRKTPDVIRVLRSSNDGVFVGVLRGRSVARCRRGLHELSGSNVYVNPRNGQRVCQECRRVSARARYHHEMKHMPPAILEERRAANRENLRRQRAARKERRLSA